MIATMLIATIIVTIFGVIAGTCAVILGGRIDAETYDQQNDQDSDF